MRRDDEAAWFNELYLLAPVGYFVLGFDSRILLAPKCSASPAPTRASIACAPLSPRPSSPTSTSSSAVPRGGRIVRRQIGSARTLRETLPPHRPQRRRGHLGDRRRRQYHLRQSENGRDARRRHRGNAGPPAARRPPLPTPTVSTSSTATLRGAARGSPSIKNSNSGAATAVTSGPRWRPIRSSTAPAIILARWRW